MKRNIVQWMLVGVVLLCFGLALPSRPATRVETFSNAALAGEFLRTTSPEELANAEGSGAWFSTPELIERALRNGAIDQETASLYLAYALSNDQKLPAEFLGNKPWDGTLPLLRLRQAAQAMKAGAARTSIEIALAGYCDDSNGSLPNTHNSTHFHIQFGTISGGLTISSYAASLETTWATEVTDFGWAAPPVLLSNPPPGNRYHVRIDDLGSSLYGYVSSGGAHAGFVGNNPNTAWNDQDAYASCMVLNRDYSPFPGSSQQALDATTAHEFNHSIQFGLGALSGAKMADEVFIEGGASWMEDEVFDSSNDNYNYLWPNFRMCMGEYTASPYNYWITFRGLSERYGAGLVGGAEQVMQDFWELTSRGISGNLGALNTALVNKGATLADAYHAYAIAVKFNKACTGGYGYPYCLEEGPSYVATRGSPSVHGSISSSPGSYHGMQLPDNYALNWVSLPKTGGAYSVTLNNTSGGGLLRGSVVCDTGATLLVNPLPAVVGAGGSTTLAYFNPAGCASVIAVLTNQLQTAENPGSCTNRSYTLSLAAAAPLTVTPTPTATGTATPTPTATATLTPTATPTSTLGPPMDQFFYLPLLFYFLPLP